MSYTNHNYTLLIKVQGNIRTRKKTQLFIKMSNSGGRRLKQWLMEQIQSAQYSGLQWEDESRTMFRIPWKHAGKQDYNQEIDASIFKVCEGLLPCEAAQKYCCEVVWVFAQRCERKTKTESHRTVIGLSNKNKLNIIKFLSF